MKNRWVVYLGCLCLVGLLASGASAGPKEDTMDLVKKGNAFIKQNGIEKAVEAFAKDEFKKGELYLFVYDLKGNCLAQGARPEFIGKNLWNLKSPTGQFLIRDQVEMAKKGGGWTEYQWMHEVKKVLGVKETFVMPLDGMEGYVACGYFKE
jgi:cytochrome c